MITPNELFDEFNVTKESLNKCNKEFLKQSELLAQKQAEYDKKYSVKLKELEQENKVTIVKELAKGELVDLKMKISVAEARIQYLKLKNNEYHATISWLQSRLKWLNDEYKNSGYGG